MSTPDVDPILFEVLRHRLWAINDEAATTIARVSGSPVANEAFDFNTALMDADGNVVMIGAYVMAHAAALDRVVRYVIEEHADNPGIGPGDMYVTNDPYVGAMHQPDVALVSPIFHEGELVMWCGSVVHQSDVGGPVAGSISVGARSIYEEAIPLAPIRIVEGDRLRKDLEREYLIRSRMPGLNALDLRGQIAANRVQAKRVGELCDRYGREAIVAATANLVDSTEQRFRARLRELPDGRWQALSLVEHDGVADEVYRVALELTKEGDRLILDFSDSSDQAPALINTTKGALAGYSLAPILGLLAYDIPWAPAAFWRCIELRSREGSIVDASWPAGVSMATTATGHAIRTVVNVCVANMLDGADAYADRPMASCMGSFAGQNIAGVKADGSRFGTMLMDSLAGGGGARTFADGVDTSGVLNAPKSAIGNVEVNEYNYPILYLWRRQTPDSGGPGRYRGGVGGEHAYVVHHADAVDCVLFAHGIEQPTGTGLAGGEPGAPNRFMLVRDGRDLAARHIDELGGTPVPLPPKGAARIGPRDVFVHVYGGGGGFGDPLDRPAAEVLRDVAAGLVTVAGAARDYGVVVRDGAGDAPVVDDDATAALRARLRRERLGGRDPQHAARAGHARDGHRLSSTTAVVERGGERRYACQRCGCDWGPVGAPLKAHLAVQELGVHERWSAIPAGDGARRFVLRRFACPGCATQVEAEVNLAGAAPLRSLEALQERPLVAAD